MTCLNQRFAGSILVKISVLLLGVFERSEVSVKGLVWVRLL